MEAPMWRLDIAVARNLRKSTLPKLCSVVNNPSKLQLTLRMWYTERKKVKSPLKTQLPQKI